MNSFFFFGLVYVRPLSYFAEAINDLQTPKPEQKSQTIPITMYNLHPAPSVITVSLGCTRAAVLFVVSLDDTNYYVS